VSDKLEKDEFIEAYRQQLGEIDEVAKLILNGHLEVEAELDEVLKAIFLHPKHLLENRLTFVQKAQIARAYAIRQNEWPHWRLIKALNAVRNEAAHGKRTERRTKKIAELQTFILQAVNLKVQERLKVAGEEEIVVTAAAIVSGYLTHLRDSILSMRHHFELLDEEMFSDEPRVPSETKLSHEDDEKE